VTLSVPGFPGATIYYTLNGKIPTRSTGTVYSAPIQLIQPSTIIAFASMQDCQDGPTAIQKFGYPVDPIRLMGNNQIGIPNGELLLPFTADITALVRNRSAAWGQEVTFTARSPSGADITANLWNVSDWTGSSGFLGIVSTFLTLGNETGVYTVTAHYGGNDVTFEAETVTPLSVTGTDENYAPGPGIEDPSRQLVSVSGQRPNITHVLGADLSNGQGMITGYAETAPGSGMFAPDTPPLPPSPSQSPGFVTKYASADYTKDFRSYWDDSDEFELDFLQADLSDWGFLDPKESRGSARSPYRHLVWNGEAWDPGDFPRPPGWIDMTKHFLKVAGYNAIQSTVLGMTTYQFIPDQAHVLYISTHGYHDGNTLVTQDGLFSPLETDWGKGLSMVVIAGCSVLDVTGSKPRWAGTQSANIAPGRKWAATGPCVLLGYEESAPIDRFLSWNGFSDAGPKQVVSQWIFSMEFELASPIYAWMYANWYYQQSVHKNCHNATAIHACSTPKKAYHLIGNLGATFLSSLQEVPESQWKGQD